MGRRAPTQVRSCCGAQLRRLRQLLWGCRCGIPNANGGARVRLRAMMCGTGARYNMMEIVLVRSLLDAGSLGAKLGRKDMKCWAQMK